jgi:hypothetical protein
MESGPATLRSLALDFVQPRGLFVWLIANARSRRSPTSAHLRSVARALQRNRGMRSPFRTLDYSEDALPLVLRPLTRSRARVVFAHAPPRRAHFREVPSVIVVDRDVDPEDECTEARLSRELRRLPTVQRAREKPERARSSSIGAFLLSAVVVVGISTGAAFVAGRMLGPAPTAADLLGIH